MEYPDNPEIIIIGGGLAGLTAALHLSKAGLQTKLIEKYEYPHHKVCGEYLSNEVLPYLNTLGIDPIAKKAKNITKFQITDQDGKELAVNLPMGGIGISRYSLDNMFYEAIKDKVQVVFDTVQEVNFDNNRFQIKTQKKQSYKADLVLGAFGKRSNLDTFLKRKFISQKSPWLAVKAHYSYDFPDDTVSLHNFEGGYCGLSKTESNDVNACYLTTYNSFKKQGNIDGFQKVVLSKNPYLKDFFANAVQVFDKPLSISQISFQHKNPVEDHVLMIGDSAGLIHPLCGNGMAMAIHSGKIASESILESIKSSSFNRLMLEQKYTEVWEKTFRKRIYHGRLIQKVLMNPMASKIGFSMAKNIPFLLPKLIQKTHGRQSI